MTKKMIHNFREFEAGPDPYGRIWKVQFVWQQTAISIRRSDSVDVKFIIDDGELQEERVIALMHPRLKDLSSKTGHPLNDAWCMKLAAVHLKRMIETGEDIEKNLITMTMEDMERAHAELEKYPTAVAH